MNAKLTPEDEFNKRTAEKLSLEIALRMKKYGGQTMYDWLSLPSGEMVRVSEIAAVEARHPEVGRHSPTSALILKNGLEIRTPWQVSDVQRQITAIQQRESERGSEIRKSDITPELEWHLSKRVLAAYVDYRNTAWANNKGAVVLAEWLGMVAEDYLTFQERGEVKNDVKDDYKRLLYQFGDHMPNCKYRLGYRSGEVSIHDESTSCNCGWYEIRFNVKEALDGPQP